MADYSIHFHVILQTHWFGWPCRETFKQGNTKNWYVQNPFSCEYYQYTENIHLARTKIILSCLLLLEAHGLEFYYIKAH